MENQDLKRVGLKITQPRIKILEIFESRPAIHMTADDVYKVLADEGVQVGIATVYRVLTQFESTGLLKRHHFEEGQSVFELNQGLHHDHILCVRCGKVEEFIDETIEDRQRTIVEKAGFTMTDHCLYIYGVCSDCQSDS
ncbi:MAG: ferric iron uptake transcriptional regulator [Gammaproteobacteria bacterium]|nr:MAG: ferric iron uptake transcriptional regulator [Gammaproteobacteria bacterium]